jgi:hypothetical protein
LKEKVTPTNNRKRESVSAKDSLQATVVSTVSYYRQRSRREIRVDYTYMYLYIHVNPVKAAYVSVYPVCNHSSLIVINWCAFQYGKHRKEMLDSRSVMISLSLRVTSLPLRHRYTTQTTQVRYAHTSSLCSVLQEGIESKGHIIGRTVAYCSSSNLLGCCHCDRQGSTTVRAMC